MQTAGLASSLCRTFSSVSFTKPSLSFNEEKSQWALNAGPFEKTQAVLPSYHKVHSLLSMHSHVLTAQGSTRHLLLNLTSASQNDKSE